MTLHAEGLRGGAVDAMGVTVDGGAALTIIVVDRMWKIRQVFVEFCSVVGVVEWSLKSFSAIALLQPL